MAQAHIALPFRPRRGLVARVIAAIAVVASRRRDRTRLGQLETHLLRDIGLTAQDARDECAKPFWKA